MPTTRTWTKGEFTTLLRNGHLTEGELMQVLGGRSTDELAMVRQGVHSWHRGQRATPLLSRPQRAWLEERTEPIVCAVCQVAL